MRAEARQAWASVIRNTDIKGHLVLENCKRYGKLATCEWFGAANVDAMGCALGSLWMVHDLTEQLHLQEKILRSQRMESLCSFAGGIAHDMANVIRTIMDAAVSQQGLSSGKTSAGSTDQILRSCERARSLVRGLLDFSRCDLLDKQSVDLNAILDEQIHLLGHSMDPGVRVERDYQRNLPTVTGDAFALGGAFMHVILNALDAMPSGGTLTLRTRVNEATGDVTVYIQDSGCGMAKEVLDRAMEPFFTTRPAGQGLGLGLPAVYGAIKAHRGSLDIQSEPNRGTLVTINIPLVRDMTTTGKLPAIAEVAACGLRILLVDDDSLVQATISAQLSKLGHEVVIANQGQEALDKLQEGAEIDLVLLDLDMPVLSGRKTLPLLRKLRPALPVIIETGSMDAAVGQLAAQFADVAVLSRPFTRVELKAALVPWVRGEKRGAV
jgi:nitrogen-specific signal transduction histidine kinase/CheY-like chemotaxis protein